MKLMTITTDEEFVDPYDHMTDEEFNEMVDGLMAKQRAVPRPANGTGLAR